MRWLGKWALRPAVWIFLGVPVLVFIAPFAVNHFVRNVDLFPKVSADVRIKEHHRQCAIAEMAKGGRTPQGQILTLAAMQNRMKEVGEQHYDPDRDLRYYVLYFPPGKEYRDTDKGRNCKFIYKWQGWAGPWMRTRVAAAEAIFDAYQRKEDIFNLKDYPLTHCVTRIIPYKAEVQTIKIPSWVPFLGGMEFQLWKTPAGSEEVAEVLKFYYEVDGSKFYGPHECKVSTP